MDHKKNIEIINKLRILKIGSKERSEKIRTFNFSNHYFTDHRLQTSSAKHACEATAEEVLRGEQHLENVIEQLHNEFENESASIGLKKLLDE